MNKLKSFVVTGLSLLLTTSFCFAESLLLDAPTPLKAKTAALSKRQRYVKINQTIAPALSKPGTQFELPLFDGEQFTLQVDKVTSTASNSFTIRCSVPGQPANYAVLARENDAFTGSFHLKDRLFQVGTFGGATHYLSEADPTITPTCGVKGKTEPTPVYVNNAAPATGATSPVNVMAGELVANVASNRPVLDVMVLYTPAALAGAGGEDVINSQIKLAMEEGQLALDNSQVNIQLRLVHTEMINYTEVASFSTNLSRLANPSDGFMDTALPLRDKYKADILSLWVEQWEPPVAGLGYQLLPQSTLYTYNVIYRPLATGTYIPIHEIGHNFGCDHEPAHSLPGGPLYPYAHGYIFQTPAGHTKTTVMTAVSDSRRIPYFSNPNVMYDEFGTGTDLVPVGTADANNALVMNNTAAKLTSFRVPPSLGEALDATTISWTTGGDKPWFWQPGATHDNVDAAQTGPIADSQITWLQGVVTGPARLSYWWSSSSETSHDFLSFYLDNGLQWAESGDNFWFHEVIFIPTGSHTIKWQYAKDGANFAGQDAAWVDQVSVTPVKLPTVTITAPAINARLFSATTNVTGTAHDDTYVDHVEYQLRNAAGTTGWMMANGTTAWSAPIDMVAGTNTITVRSIGFGGQTSLPISRSFFYVVTNQITVSTNGNGKILPAMNGKFLEIGRPYTITATPSNNWVFSNWTGSVSSTNAALTFLMQSNMTLQANFVTNPFIPVQGIFRGLFREADAVRQSSAGFLTFTLTKPGTYSARMTLDGATYSFNGKFDLNGFSKVTVPRARTNSVVVTLQMNLVAPDDTVQGTISNSSWVADFKGDRAVFNALSNKAVNYAGKYASAIFGNNEPVAAPEGDSYATVTIDNAGLIRATGMLGDGTPFNQSVSISKNGSWPLFQPLYLNKGMVFGEVTFSNTPATTLGGDITWIKPAMRTTYYSNGFTLNTALIGSSFVMPSNGVRMLNITNGTLRLTGANLPFDIVNPVVLNSNNTVTVTGTNGTAIVLNKLTGSMGGSHFIDPATRLSVPIYGVVLQNQNEARGFFKGKTQTGAALLQGN